MATYYVATSGNNANSGSIGSPWLTIPYGVAQLNAGDTLYIRGGTYNQGIVGSDFTDTGTAGNPIIISGYPGETVTLPMFGAGTGISFYFSGIRYVEIQDVICDGSADSVNYGVGLEDDYITLRRVRVTAVWKVGVFSGGNNNQYLDCIIDGNGREPSTSYAPGHSAMYLTGDNNLIQGGQFYNNSGFAIRFGTSAAAPDRSINNLVERITAYENGYGIGLNGTSDCGSGGGGLVLGDSDNIVRNSIIYGNLIGLEINGLGGKIAQRIKSYNNTYYNNVVGITVGANTGANDTELINNILRNNGTDINYVTHTNTVATTNFTGNPLFTNPGANDFTLQAGSPCIDTGTTIASVTNDFLGSSRPFNVIYDIGAYEYNATILNHARISQLALEVISLQVGTQPIISQLAVEIISLGGVSVDAERRNFFMVLG